MTWQNFFNLEQRRVGEILKAKIKRSPQFCDYMNCHLVRKKDNTNEIYYKCELIGRMDANLNSF